MAVPGWFWQHLPFFVLALVLPAQMIFREYTAPDKVFATEKVSRVFDVAVDLVEDAALSLAKTLESWGVSSNTVDRLPLVHRDPLPPKDLRKPNHGPIELDVAGIRRALHRHQYVLINFYAPWCVHCRAFEPTFKTIAERLHSDPSLDILVAKVDGTKHKRLLDRHEIDAYPSVLLYMHGDVDRPAQYIDIRDPDMMVQWVNREVQKLAAGGAGEDSYFGKSVRPKWRVRKVLYRVGDVVRDEAAAPGMDRKGIVIGWDYFAHGPPEWLNSIDASLHDIPHYRVLWDASTLGLEENPSYVAQTALKLVLDAGDAAVQHPQLGEHFAVRQDHDRKTYELNQRLRVLYPDD